MRVRQAVRGLVMAEAPTPLETELRLITGKLLAGIKSLPVLILNEPLVEAIQNAQALAMQEDPLRAAPPTPTPRNPTMAATDLTKAQLARLREDITAVIDDWRSDFRIEWDKTHDALANHLTMMMFAKHRDGELTMHPINHKEPAGQGGI